MTQYSALTKYAEAFRKLRKDRSAKTYPEMVKGASPHKPLLLLAVLDLLSESGADRNFITLNPELHTLFNSYWLQVMPHDWHGDIGLPFFHLSREAFWHLQPHPGSEYILQAGRRLISIKQLHDHVAGAQLDDELFALICDETARNALRAVLIETHFVRETHDQLFVQGHVNQKAYTYSQRLLEKALQRSRPKNAVKDEFEEISESVRSQGFRRAIVTIYEHRCAICGLRIQTVDSHTVVDAAHIVPWRVSHNDDVNNGIALCKLCHWTFDKGLLGISTEYAVLTSSELNTNYNLPGHLLNLAGRSMLKPSVSSLQPDKQALQWHLRYKFRR